MTHRSFSLFQTPIDLAHAYWKRGLKPGDTVLDATCGNGHDTLFLSQLVLDSDIGQVIACDIQESALAQTRQRLIINLPPGQIDRVQLLHDDHSKLSIEAASLAAVIYNLGYLPGGDKSLTTTTTSTLNSLDCSLKWIQEGGFICVTCYPGHPSGAEEEEKVLEWAQTLSPQEWSVCHHRFLNRRRSPSLLLIQSGIYTKHK